MRGLFDTGFPCLTRTCIKDDYSYRFIDTSYEAVIHYESDWLPIQSDSILRLTVSFSRSSGISSEINLSNLLEKQQIIRKSIARKNNLPIQKGIESINSLKYAYLIYDDTFERNHQTYHAITGYANTTVAKNCIDFYLTYYGKAKLDINHYFLEIIRSIVIIPRYKTYI